MYVCVYIYKYIYIYCLSEKDYFVENFPIQTSRKFIAFIMVKLFSNDLPC